MRVTIPKAEEAKPKKILLLLVMVLFGGAVFLLSQSFFKSAPSFVSPLGKGREKETQTLKRYEVFGFLPYWMIKNHKLLRYDLLSTIAYFGLHIGSEGEFIKIKADGNSELGWLNWKKNKDLDQVIAMAKKTNVRFALTIIAQDNSTIEEFLSCSPCGDRLTDNLTEELREKQVTDLNLDFEYSGVPDMETREQYSAFVEKITQKLHETIPGSRLTVDTFAEAAHKTKLHDVEALGRAADGLFIMAYDFHKLTDDKTGPIAPLGGAPDKYKYDLELMLRDYLRFVEMEKLIIGVAYYGYDWITEDENLGSLRVPGNVGIGYSHVSYYGICEYHQENTGVQKKWDEDAQAPWFYYYDEEHDVYRQCHYENRDSLAAKYDFIKENNLRGVGIWALGYDGNYPELWDLLEEKF